MSLTKPYSIEKRITRSVARTLVDKNLKKKSSGSIGCDDQLKNVDDSQKNGMRKKKTVIEEGNESKSGLCINQYTLFVHFSTFLFSFTTRINSIGSFSNYGRK